MTTLRFVDVEVSDAVATVWMDRPPVNAVSQDMYRELRAVFADLPAHAGAGVKVAILAGRGRHFCAGNDLEEFATLSPHNSDARMADVRAAFYAVQDCPIPVVGAVHGAALGTGLALAASCDLVVAAETAVFGTPEVGVGIMGGARHLARLVPQPWVRWMYFSGDPIPARRLYELGGAVVVVPDGELVAAARERAARIARHSGALLRMAKRSLNAIENMDLQSGYRLEQSLTTAVSAHPDSREAVLATLERRPPHYAPEA